MRGTAFLRGRKTDMKIINKECEGFRGCSRGGEGRREWWADGVGGDGPFTHPSTYPLFTASAFYIRHKGTTTGGLIITVRLRTSTRTACVCLRQCLCLITAHCSRKSDNSPQTAAGCSLHAHWTAVMVLIAIWANYWGNKGEIGWSLLGLRASVNVGVHRVKSSIFIGPNSPQKATRGKKTRFTN